MIGIDIGSLTTEVSLGTQNPSKSHFEYELLLSDTSSRSTPSILSYTEIRRLIGDQASLVMRKNVNSTFQYINRLIGLIMKSNFGQKELNEFFIVGGDQDIENNKFNFNVNNENYSLSTEDIITAFINKIKQQYIIDKKIEPQIYVFSVPDYFTCYQKNSLMNSIQSCGIKNNFHLINDSTAITLYFGYKKYREYFITNTKVHKVKSAATIDPTITKHIIFIDAGHSKTTFVLSKLNFNLFTVLDSVSLPFLGGRNFDEEIFKFCAEKFKEKTGDDILNNKKCKLRLLNVISKSRKALTVNQDVSISVDCLFNDNDFTYLLTRKEFETICEKQINEFKETFQKFYEKNLKLYQGINISNIEMGGELMRTPCLENIIKEITKIEMSKTILTDECIAVGCSLYGSLLKNCFPIENFQGIYHLNNYSIHYSINNSPTKVLISNQYKIPYFPVITLDENYFNDDNVNLFNIDFYHSKNEIEFYLPTENSLLIEYQIDKTKVLELNGSLKNLILDIMIDNNGFVFIKNLQSKNDDGETINIPLTISNGVIKVSKREIYQNPKERIENIKNMNERELRLIKIDEDFKIYDAKRNQLEGRCYEIKNKISGKEIENKDFNGKSLREVLNDIENNLVDIQSKVTDLNPIEKQFEEIFEFMTPSDIINEKKEFLEKIKNYKNDIINEQDKIAKGEEGKYTQKQIEDALNMLEHFQTKLGLEDNKSGLTQLINEFNAELKKYF